MKRNTRGKLITFIRMCLFSFSIVGSFLWVSWCVRVTTLNGISKSKCCYASLVPTRSKDNIQGTNTCFFRLIWWPSNSAMGGLTSAAGLGLWMTGDGKGFVGNVFNLGKHQRGIISLYISKARNAIWDCLNECDLSSSLTHLFSMENASFELNENMPTVKGQYIMMTF